MAAMAFSALFLMMWTFAGSAHAADRARYGDLVCDQGHNLTTHVAGGECMAGSDRAVLAG
jgi:hypothetical protein